MWNWFTQILFEILRFFESFVGDWGMAIIILTFIIRLLLTPLTVKSTRSQARMQALQPKMKAIQERYKDDPAAQTAAMREFYANNQFSPLGGCLPMLLQMPIFFGLYSVLSYMLPPEAHFYNIIDSLGWSTQNAVAAHGITGALIFIVMDVLFGVLTLVPILLNAKNSAPEQQKQMYIMGVVMGLAMLYFGTVVPVGVLLYYDTSAAWGVIQQVFITQKVTEKIKAEEAAKAGATPIEVDVVRKEKKARPRKKN